MVVRNRRPGFVQARIQSNPVITRMVRQSHGRRRAWRLIGLACLFTFIGLLIDRKASVINVMVFVGLLSLIVNPFFGVLTAANQTCQMIASESYQLLFLTALPDMKLVEAYIFAVLYRLRFPLVLMVGLIPSIVVRLMASGYDRCMAYGTQCLPPAPHRPGKLVSGLH